MEPNQAGIAASAATPSDPALSPPFSGPQVTWFGSRIGRLRYLTWLLVSFIGVHAVEIGLAMGGWPIHPTGHLLPIALWLAQLVFAAVLTVKRSHDLGHTGWISPIAMIPLVGFYWVFAPGQRMANRWGPPPAPNSLQMKLLAVGALALLALAMLLPIGIAYLLYRR